MKALSKGIIGLMLIIILSFSLIGCSSTSEDPINDTTMLYATISRIERQTPGGMGFSEEQANQLLEIINPIVIGLPFTSDVAEDMYVETNKLLTKEQKKLIDDNSASIGQGGTSTGYPAGAGAGAGGGMGAGGGAGIEGGGTPGAYSAEGMTGINLFLRLDEIITENYLK